MSDEPIKPTFGQGEFTYFRDPVLEAPDENGLDDFHRLVGARLHALDVIDNGATGEILEAAQQELLDIDATEAELRILVPDLDERERVYRERRRLEDEEINEFQSRK